MPRGACMLFCRVLFAAMQNQISAAFLKAKKTVLLIDVVFHIGLSANDLGFVAVTSRVSYEEFDSVIFQSPCSHSTYALRS